MLDFSKINVPALIAQAKEFPSLAVDHWLVVVPILGSFLTSLLFGGVFDDKWYRKIKKPR